MEQGRPEAALADYRAAVARGGIFHGNLAQALLAAGRRDEALKYTREMLARADVTPASRVDFGLVLLKDGDVRGATDVAYQMASLSREPQIVWRGQALLVGTLNYAHRPGEALEVIEKYEQVRGTDPLTLTMRAFTYARLGRPELAMDNATRLYAVQPDTPQSLRARGDALAAAGRYDEAASDYVRLSDKNPDAICAFASLGDVRLARGELDAAIAAYRRHQEATPKYGSLCAAQADFGWGRALVASGKPDEALAKFAAAAKRDPDDVALWRVWAAVLGNQGKSREAAAKLDEARSAEARLAVPVKLN